MANKRISELNSRTPVVSDLMLVGDPTTGYSYKSTISAVLGLATPAVSSVFGRTGAVVATEGDYTLTLLGDVTITTPVLDNVLMYNGTTWVNSENYSNKIQHRVKLGAAIGKGKAVYVSGADGTNIIVSVASNDSEVASSKVLGLTAAAGNTNDFVYVVSEGLLSGLNTTGATIGDPVWLGTNGNLLYGVANKPVAPANLVYLGVVTRVNSNNGEIFVKVQNGFEIEELHDVLISSPTNGQALTYNSTTGLWQNSTISVPVTSVFGRTGAVVATEGDYSLTLLSDVTLSSPSNGQVLQYNGTTWVNATISPTNIYTSDGTLTGNRTVTMAGNTLTFSGGSLIQDRSVNAALEFKVRNTNTGTAASAAVVAEIGTNKIISIGKVGDNYTTYKILTAQDAYIYNSAVGGDIAILNDFTTGRIKFAAGGSTTAHFTIFNTGNIGINTTTDAGFRLDVNGTARVTNELRLNNRINFGGTFFLTYGFSSGVAILQNSFGTDFDRLCFGGNGTGTFYPAIFKTTNGFAFKSTDGSLFRDIESATGFFYTSVGVGSATINASAILDITSTTRGFLMPRMTTTQRDAISTPATGLQVYNTTDNVPQWYNGTAWTNFLTNNVYTADGTIGGSRTITMDGGNFHIVSGSVGIGTTSVDGCAILELDSTTKGLLIPRMTTTERNNISNPVAGLILFNTTSSKLTIYNGLNFVEL